jgi:DNA-binding Lrp family transcriptional regulator
MMSAQRAFDFDGITYDATRDGPRMTKQLQKVKRLMSDGQWYTLSQIATACGCSESSASARLRDLRKAKFGAHTVERKNCGGGVWVYRVKI